MAEDQQDYRLEVLRAAGHGDAADLLAKLPKQGPADAEPETEAQPPARQMTPADAVEAQRHAEGAAVLAQMKAQISSKWFEADEVTR